jgi:hypothetical protein
MATALKLRRGTTAQHASFTGLEAELTIDTTKDTAVVHDGSTAGGFPLARESATIAKTSATGSAALPSGTTAQRDGSPAAGYIRFNSTLNSYEGYNGTAWSQVGGGATGAGGDTVFQENSLTVNNSYTLTTGKNAASVGPITIASGATVTVPSGQRWVVL